MKNVHLLRAAVLTLGLIVCLAMSAAPVTLSLSAEPSRRLPGIPVSFRVTLSNQQEVPFTLPLNALLRVFPPGGAPFIAKSGYSDESPFSLAKLPENSEAVRIAPHASATFVYAARDISDAPAWFVDPRLNQIGTYRLQLLLVADLEEQKVYRAAADQIENVLDVRATSNVVVVTVDEPRGDDLAVYERLVALAARRDQQLWSPVYWNLEEELQVATHAIEEHPRSAYAPYLLQEYRVLPHGRQLEAARRVLSEHPRSPNREYLALFVAQMEAFEGRNAEFDVPPNLKLAIEMYERARADLTSLERDAADPEVRRTSRAEREKIPKLEDLQRRALPQEDGERPR